MDWLRPYLSRIIGSGVAAVVAWLTSKFAINVDSDTQAQVVEAVVTILLPVFAITQTVVMRTIDKKLNPGDAASSHLAVADKARADVMKQEREDAAPGR